MHELDNNEKRQRAFKILVATNLMLCYVDNNFINIPRMDDSRINENVMQQWFQLYAQTCYHEIYDIVIANFKSILFTPTDGKVEKYIDIFGDDNGTTLLFRKIFKHHKFSKRDVIHNIRIVCTLINSLDRLCKVKKQLTSYTKISCNIIDKLDNDEIEKQMNINYDDSKSNENNNQSDNDNNDYDSNNDNNDYFSDDDGLSCNDLTSSEDITSDDDNNNEK